MNTVTTTPKIRKPRKVKPAHGTCSLTLTINGTAYRLARLHPHPEIASLAYSLRKDDGTAYHVRIGEHGTECDCPDWTYNRAGQDPHGCKHVKSLRAWGLLLESIPTHRSTGDFAANDPPGYEEQFGSDPESAPLSPEEREQHEQQ